ncbi:hypothetical protein [Methylosinus sp. Sm6]|uniref:hypothetical protein n=1 Tax=Methylosinus sp. Sm6 TaxID=2866948 RepID=UPI001C98F77A|nr:hypothetical protein [Methylosinus sp. Sm6]MBY6240805.1 hypothetical protein [Methylosinus sp. Sm6]
MRPFFAYVLIAAAFASPARAAEDGPSSIGSAIGRAFEGAGLRNAPPPTAEFVGRSRPADLDYAPFAPKEPRPDRKQAQADADARLKELEAAGAAARARAARVKTPDAPPPKTRDAATRRP